jgi:hypothetical protein
MRTEGRILPCHRASPCRCAGGQPGLSAAKPGATVPMAPTTRVSLALDAGYGSCRMGSEPPISSNIRIAPEKIGRGAESSITPIPRQHACEHPIAGARRGSGDADAARRCRLTSLSPAAPATSAAMRARRSPRRGTRRSPSTTSCTATAPRCAGARSCAVAVHGEVADETLVRRVLREQRIDCVIHFAGYGYVGESMQAPGKYFQNNVAGTIALLNAMRAESANCLVFSSTCADARSVTWT